MNLRWGLRRGLLSGLLNTTSGALEAPAGGWPPAEAMALFTLWPASPRPCKDENKSRHAARTEETEMAKKSKLLTRGSSPPLLPSSSSLG